MKSNYVCGRERKASPHLTSPLGERDSTKKTPPTPCKGEGAGGGGDIYILGKKITRVDKGKWLNSDNLIISNAMKKAIDLNYYRRGIQEGI
ncbi:MAG: hypothetical protein Q9M97_02865 [Candidatus Gracilibacteria bacterium]|nr:hypothetical protein [Candidatus Gracilibacteria bacterium]